MTRLWYSNFRKLGDICRDPPRLVTSTAHCSASDLGPNLSCGVPGDKIHDPCSDRARAVVRRHSSYGRRDEGEGRHRTTRKGRIAGSHHDKRLAEKALRAKTKIKLTLAPSPQKQPQARGRARGWLQFVASNVRLLRLGGQGCRADGVAAQPWPNTSILPCDLHWGCDRRHRKADRTSVCPVLSITTKQASNSSTVQGGGKRREPMWYDAGALLAIGRRFSRYRLGAPAGAGPRGSSRSSMHFFRKASRASPCRRC
jgi:hypothetical protein